MDRLQSMRVFLKTSQLGSFSAAGRELNISPSMATKHVRSLEESLGIRLFNRTTRQITPTEAGKLYREGIESILDDVDALDNFVSAHNLAAHGELRITAPVSFGAKQIAPLVVDFQKKHPALTVELELNDRVVNLIEEGFDIAIRVGRLPPSTLIARKLAPCHTILCASPSYLREHGYPRNLTELQKHPCLCYTLAREGPHIWTFGKDGDMALEVSGPMKSNNGSAIVRFHRA